MLEEDKRELALWVRLMVLWCLLSCVTDGDLDVVFTSSSKCGKDKTKSVSSTIFFHCDPLVKDGVPEFSHETADCQYLFSWYTSAVCPLG